MNLTIYHDEKKLYAFVLVGHKANQVVLGTWEDVESASYEEKIEMIYLAVTVHFFEQMTSSKGMTLH